MSKDQIFRNCLFIVLTIIICIYSFAKFGEMEEEYPIYPGENVEIVRLSNYFDGIKGTNADTDVYIYGGQEDGGSALILGGTHPNEPAGFITAVLLIERLKVNKGRVIIIPRANNSGFTCTDPQEGVPQEFRIETSDGIRKFRHGSRFMNILDQWPDPEVYLHYPSGQKLSGNERRNLNRSYPGKPDGVLTEKLAHAIVQLINTERIDISIDLHEASLEYPVIDAIVAHERSMDVAAMAQIDLQILGIDYNLEPSPVNFRGFSHREWGDYTETMPFLIESANPIQGRMRGETTEELLLKGYDKYYAEASELGLLYTPYPAEGIPLEVRTGRHLEAIKILISTFSLLNPEKEIGFSDLPSYSEIIENKLGYYLKTGR